jgi:hypothetical protein
MFSIGSPTCMAVSGEHGVCVGETILVTDHGEPCIGGPVSGEVKPAA